MWLKLRLLLKIVFDINTYTPDNRIKKIISFLEMLDPKFEKKNQN